MNKREIENKIEGEGREVENRWKIVMKENRNEREKKKECKKKK